jgi:redox-sensitive bicupin YhaK (pirin superfamily)
MATNPHCGTLEMAQLWVNLRAVDKDAPAGYQTLLDREIPSVALPGKVGSVRVIAGEYGRRDFASGRFGRIA